MLWRDQPGGYLKEILTARVYDVAVRQSAWTNALHANVECSHVLIMSSPLCIAVT